MRLVFGVNVFSFDSLRLRKEFLKNSLSALGFVMSFRKAWYNFVRMASKMKALKNFHIIVTSAGTSMGLLF